VGVVYTDCRPRTAPCTLYEYALELFLLPVGSGSARCSEFRSPESESESESETQPWTETETGGHDGDRESESDRERDSGPTGRRAERGERESESETRRLAPYDMSHTYIFERCVLSKREQYQAQSRDHDAF
jgi:hypothetical protein